MQKGKIIVGAMAGMALVGALGVVENSYAYTPTTEEEAAVESVMSELETIYQAEIDEYNAERSDIQMELVDEYHIGAHYTLPYYRSSAMKVYSALDTGSFLGVQRTDEESIHKQGVDFDSDQTLAVSLVDTLVDLGFIDYGGLYMGFHQYLNEETGVICAIADMGLSANCGHINWQIITDEWREFANKIGAAYYAKKSRYPYLGRIMDNNELLPTIHDSEYEPYQYVDVTTLVGAELFYRSSAEADWVYYAGTNGIFSCNDFAGEAAKGFAGYKCYDEETGEMSKVRVVEEEVIEEEAKKESGVKAPDTGALTDEDGGSAMAITTSVVVTLMSAALWLAIYVKGRIEKRVRLGKK